MPSNDETNILLISLIRDMKLTLEWLGIGLTAAATVWAILSVRLVSDHEWIPAGVGAILTIFFALSAFGAARRSLKYCEVEEESSATGAAYRLMSRARHLFGIHNPVTHYSVSPRCDWCGHQSAKQRAIADANYAASERPSHDEPNAPTSPNPYRADWQYTCETRTHEETP